MMMMIIIMIIIGNWKVQLVCQLQQHYAKFKTRPAKFVQHNIEARSYNYCCSGKAVSIAFSDCVFVA